MCAARALASRVSARRTAPLRRESALRLMQKVVKLIEGNQCKVGGNEKVHAQTLGGILSGAKYRHTFRASDEWIWTVAK